MIARLIQFALLLLAGMLLTGSAYWINPVKGQPNLPTSGLFAFLAVFCAVLVLEIENETKNRPAPQG